MGKRMLYACAQLPWPPDNGAKIATLSDLERLAPHFEIDVAACIDPLNLPRREEHLAALRERLPAVRFLEPVVHRVLRRHLVKDRLLPLLRSVATLSPYVVNRYRNRRYRELVRARLRAEPYAVLALENLSPTFVLPLPEDVRARTMVVYRAFDIFTETLEGYARERGMGPAGLAVRLDRAICGRYERRLWRTVDAILPVTRRMARRMGESSPSAAARVVYFPVVVPDLPPPPPRRGTHRVLYLGTVHYPPNLSGLQWFLRECWPRVLERDPRASLDVVGRGGEALRPVPPSVRVHGYVEDAAPFYEAADLLVVPLLSGSGVRLKILEAFNRGLPVVSTTAGYQGLELEPGREIRVADEARGLADEVAAVLTDPSRRDALAVEGRRFLAENHAAAVADAAARELRARAEARA